LTSFSRTIIGVFFVCLAPPVYGTQAEDELMDEFALLEDQDVIFTAAKHKQKISESPSAVTVITREAIENTHCTDIICILQQAPEVDVLRISPMLASVGARALTNDISNRVLLLIDGKEANVDMWGLTLWQALNIHLEDIERIEVVRGPGSALYGANAHSMVVSVTTRTTTDEASSIFLGSGEHDRSSLHLRVNQVLGGWILNLSGGLDTAGNWEAPKNRERTFNRLRLRLSREGDLGVTTLDAGFGYGFGRIFTIFAPLEFKRGILASFMASHDTGLIKTHVWFDMVEGQTVFDLPLVYGVQTLGELPNPIPFISTSLDAEVQLTWSPFEDNLLIAGTNYRWVTMLAEDNDPEAVHQHRVGVFLHDEQRLLENLLLTAGIRLDYNSMTPLTFSPRLAAVWQFTEGHSARLAFGQAFLKPAFFNTSFHIKGTRPEPGFDEIEEFIKNQIGNEDLTNEKITAFETGYVGRLLDGRLRIEATAFYGMYRDFIVMSDETVLDNMGLPDFDRSHHRFENVGMKVDSVGGSVAVSYTVKERWRFDLNYTYRYTWYLNEPQEYQAAGDVKKGDRVPWEPAHLFNLACHHIMANGLRFGAALHAASTRDFGILETGLLFDQRVPEHIPARLYPSAFLAYRASLHPGWIEIGVRAYNLLDIGYRDMPQVRRPDDSLFGGELINRRIFAYLRGAI
jgi:outer membrane receptor for ferrienterochelin and colicin